jgi:hypothetical protein
MPPIENITKTLLDVESGVIEADSPVVAYEADEDETSVV